MLSKQFIICNIRSIQNTYYIYRIQIEKLHKIIYQQNKLYQYYCK